MEKDADLIIAGGGDAGASMALAAASAGFSVILIDAADPAARLRPEFDARAWALGAASVSMLRVLGLWTALAPHAQPMRGVEVFEGRLGSRFGPGGAPPLLRFGAEDSDEPAFAWMLEDRHLRAALADALAASELIARRAPARAASASAQPAGTAVTLTDGAVLRADLLIACDGRNSALARAAGLGWARGRYDQTGLVTVLRHERPHGGVARQIFYPGGPFALLPLPGDRAAVVCSEATAQAERIAALDDAAFIQEMARRSGDLLGGVALDGPRAAFALSMTLAHEVVAPRLALAGDAAHGVHPLAGQGLNLGLRDVAALTEVLAEARRRGEDIGETGVLERYQRWRRFDSAAMSSGMDLMARLFSNDLAPLPALRRLGLRAADAIPALKRALVAEAAGRAGETPRLLRGRPVQAPHDLHYADTL